MVQQQCHKYTKDDCTTLVRHVTGKMGKGTLVLCVCCMDVGRREDEKEADDKDVVKASFCRLEGFDLR